MTEEEPRKVILLFDMPLPYYCRSLAIADEPFLWQMLFEAAHLSAEGETSIKAVMSRPELAKYVKGWGRDGDMGVIALDGDRSLGAVWLRLFSSDNPGYAYLSDRIPELAIAVLPEYRNRGIGTQLLKQIIADAKQVYPAISLSVRTDNPAYHLYQRIGFEVVPNSEIPNRVGGISATMKLDL